MKSPKPPVLSPKPNPEQLVKRFSFNRNKPNEATTAAGTASTTTTTATATTSHPDDPIKKSATQNGSIAPDNFPPKFLTADKKARENVVTSTPGTLFINILTKYCKDYRKYFVT